MVPWDPNITRIPQYQHRFGMIEESPNALHAFLGKTWDIFFWSWDIKYLLKLNHPSKPNIGNFTSVELVPKKSCTSLRSRPSSGLDPSGECTPWRKGFLEQPFLRKKTVLSAALSRKTLCLGLQVTSTWRPATAARQHDSGRLWWRFPCFVQHLFIRKIPNRKPVANTQQSFPEGICHNIYIYSHYI